MAGIMNSYFYGKAGQAEYTVDQMPKNRKELFFATLKVRFSSMIGLNLLHVLWFLPLAIWLFIAGETALMYYDDAAIPSLGNEMLASYYSDFTAVSEEYTAIKTVDETILKLEYQLEDIRHNISSIEEGQQIMIEEAAVVEGGEPTMRPVTIEELRVQEADVISKLAAAELHKTHGADESYMAELISSYNEKYNAFNACRAQAVNGNLLISLLIMVPLLIIVAIGRTGQAYVLRNWARDEHSFMFEDYKAAIKANWKQALVIGLLNGLSFVICFVAYTTYGAMAAGGNWLFNIPQMLMVVLLIVWWMMNEIIFSMMVTYEMSVITLIRNSLLMVIARLPIAFVILFFTVLIPAAVLLLVPYTAIAILVLIVIYGLIGFSFLGFVQASFANSCFDKYLNPRIEGAKVNQGLHTETEEEDEPDEQPVEQKEERFWERKTK